MLGHFSLATTLYWLVLVLAGASLTYYLLAIYCAAEFFWRRSREAAPGASDPPPISVLKPVRGLDREAYENFASFCRQDYPQYEVLFGVTDDDDPAVPVVKQVIRDHPERSIRLLIGAKRLGANCKVNNLCQLTQQARYDLLVVSDSDVRMEADYLRRVAAAFRDPQVGAVTSLYRGQVNDDLVSHIQCVASAVEDSASTIVARRLEGMQFMLGAIMAMPRKRLEEIGGFEALVNHHADDFELGHRIAARGYRVELLREPVWMLFPQESLGAFLHHELRGSIGFRNIRPLAHLGLGFTHALPWVVAAAVLAHSPRLAASFLLTYLVLRLTMAWVVGVWGLGDQVVRRNLWLLPLRDALAFLVWLASFASNRIEWRGLEFEVRKGLLEPIPSERTYPRSSPTEVLSGPVDE